MTILGSEIREREDDLCNNDTMDAALSMGERALQRGRHTRAATKMTRVAKEAMAGTGGAGDGRDGRRRGMLDKYVNELRSEGRSVITMGGARARRGVVCWFRRVDVPDPQRGVKRWHGDVAGARGALRSDRSGEKAGGYSDRSGRCRDDMRCSGQRDGALRLGEVGGLHGRGSRRSQPRRMATATADGIDRSGGPERAAVRVSVRTR